MTKEDLPATNNFKPLPRHLTELRLVTAFVVTKEAAGVIDAGDMVDILMPLVGVPTDQGYLDGDSDAMLNMGAQQTAALAGVFRHACHLVKKKLQELYPELKQELQCMLEQGRSR